jgi:hypothetical protein
LNDRHLLSQVKVAEFDYSAVDWDLSLALQAARDQFYRISLEQEDVEQLEERASVVGETDEQVKRWLVASLSFDYYSQKQLRTIVAEVADRLFAANPTLRSHPSFSSNC